MKIYLNIFVSMFAGFYLGWVAHKLHLENLDLPPLAIPIYISQEKESCKKQGGDFTIIRDYAGDDYTMYCDLPSKEIFRKKF